MFCITEDLLFWPTVLAAHWVIQAGRQYGTTISVQYGWTERMGEEWLEGGEEESQAPRSLFNAESFS